MSKDKPKFRWVRAIWVVFSPDLFPVDPRRLFLVALAVAGLGAGCSATQTTVSARGTDVPTIGIGDDVGGDIAVRPAELGDEQRVPREIDSIHMVGDSITVASKAALDVRFAALGYPDAVIQSQASKRINVGSPDNSSGTTVVRELVQQDEWNGNPDHSTELWVIALGTNDLNQYSDDAQIAAAVDALLAEVPVDAVVMWVDTFVVGSPMETDQLNAVVTQRLALRGDASIVGWSDVAWRDDVLRIDGVHPTDEGAEVFAATVAIAVGDVVVP